MTTLDFELEICPGAMEFSPDGRRLATASDGGTARIWVLSGDG